MHRGVRRLAIIRLNRPPDEDYGNGIEDEDDDDDNVGDDDDNIEGEDDDDDNVDEAVAPQ